jgi:hypothetical protein
VPGPGAAAGAKAATSAGGRATGGVASRSGTTHAAKKAGGSAAASRAGGGKGGGGSGGAKSLGTLPSFRLRREHDRNQDGQEDLFGSKFVKWIGIGAGSLLFFLVVIIAPLAAFDGSASGCGGDEEEVVPIQTNHKSDPPKMTKPQIAIRIYLVGRVMKMTPRQIITAYDVAYMESKMKNIYGGDATSRGIYQQQNFSPWTDGGRNRNNIIDTTISFFLQLRQYDHGQSIVDLAADVQRPKEEYEDLYAPELGKAVDLYAKTSQLLGTAAGVKSVQSLQGVEINGSGLDSLSLGAACSGFSATGPASVKEAETFYKPRLFKTLPANLSIGEPEQVDARIWPDAVWVLTNYHLKVANARESGHATHGDGTAMDLVPAEGNSQRVWDSTARKLALDLGWTPGCAVNGLSKSAGGLCNLVPAIIFIGYNGFEDGAHGDPAHGAAFPHIHVSWYSSCYGCGGGELVPPRNWVKVFPVSASTPTTALFPPPLFPPAKKRGKRARKA